MMKDNGLSEIIGALILVALVITGIGIIGVVLLSTPPPVSKEKVVLSSSCMQCDTNSFIIVTRHEGGDVIDPQKMKFYLSTEYYNQTFKERFEIAPTWFYPAEIYSSMDKVKICSPGDDYNLTYKYNENVKSMKNGDVIVSWYVMKKN
jgi:flagellin-like protein